MADLFKPYVLPNNTIYIQKNNKIICQTNNQEETFLIPFNSETMKNYIISFSKNNINNYLQNKLRDEFKSNSFISLEYNFYYLLFTNIKNKKVNPIPTYEDLCNLYQLFSEEYNGYIKFKEKYGGIRVDNQIFYFSIDELYTYIAQEYINQLNLLYLGIRLFELKEELENYCLSKYNSTICISIENNNIILVNINNTKLIYTYKISINENNFDFYLDFNKNNILTLGDYFLLNDKYISTLYTNIFIKYLKQEGVIK